jgi:DNA-binding FadR family transcriptional regulator
MLRHILSSYQLYIRHIRLTRAYSAEELPAILAEHRSVADAVRIRHAEGGVRAMRAHIENSRRRAIG